jgi:hypothetical protein
LPVPLPSQRHATPAARVLERRNQVRPSSSTGCYRIDSPAQNDPNRMEELLEWLADLRGLTLVVAAREIPFESSFGWKTQIVVEPLQHEEARGLFRRLTNKGKLDPNDDEHLNEILRELHRVPLAIEIVARQVRHGSTIGEVLHQLRFRRARDLPSDQSDIGSSVALAIDIAMQGGWATEEAERLLWVLSYRLRVISAAATVVPRGGRAVAPNRSAGSGIMPAGRLGRSRP